MNHTNVENEALGTETSIPLTPNRTTALVRRAVEAPSVISPPTPKPPEAPAVNPHLPSDADVQLLQQGTHCRLQEKLGAHHEAGHETAPAKNAHQKPAPQPKP